jgi:hypothetical protein
VKTISLKKVSAVAVASLGFGLLSVVPANADAVTAAGIVETVSLAKVTSTPVVGTAVQVNLGLVVGDLTGESDGDTLNIRGYLSNYPAGGFAQVTANETAVGTDSEIGIDAQSADSASGSSYIITFTDSSAMGTGETVTATSAVGIGKYSFTPAKAGTYELKVWADSDGDTTVDLTEAVQTISITVAAAATLSAGTSSALSKPGNDNAATPDSTSNALPIVGSSTAAAANVAAIMVSMNDSSNNAMASGNTITASVSGPGYLVWDSTDASTDNNSCSDTPTYSATTNRSITAQTADAVGFLYLCADNTAGATTITISMTDVAGTTSALATKTATFYSSVAKLEVSSKVRTILRSGGYWQAGAVADTAAELRARTATVIPSVVVKMTDSAGRVANSAAEPTVVSGNTAVIASGACGLDDGLDATYSSGGTGYYNCGFSSATSAKSGDKATVTIRIANPADGGLTYLTTTVDLTIGGSVAKEVLTLDKTTYAAGDNMQITITATDSSGNPVYDGAATPAGVVSSKSAIGIPTTASTYTAGKKTWGALGGVFAPAQSGAFSITADGTDAAATVLKASASVTDANAGLMTQIDALNAKIVALNALIAKIMKKLGVK